MTVLGALIQSFMQSSYIFNSVYGECIGAMFQCLFSVYGTGLDLILS